jgi:hypothetical protein
MLQAAASGVSALVDRCDRADCRRWVWVLWAVLFAGGLVHVRYHGLAFPYADEWGMADVATGARAPSWAWLFEPVNEHRVPVFKLTHTLLGEATNYNFRMMAAANTCVLAAAAAIYLVVLRKLRGRNSPADLFVLGLLQHLGHQIALTSPIMLHCVSAGSLILVAFLIVLSARQPLAPTTAAGLAAVLLLLIGNGAFGVVYAAALTCWLAYCGGSQLLTVDRRRAGIAVLCCATASAAAIAAIVVTTPLRDADPLRSPSAGHTAVGALHFLVTGLGPLGRAMRPVIDYLVASFVVGGLGWAWFRGRPRSPSATIWGVLLFIAAGVMSAIVVSHTRAGGGLADLYQTRYAVYAAPLICGVIAVWDLYAAAAWRRRMTALLVVLLPAVVLVNGRKGLEDSRQRTARMDAIAAELQAGVPTAIVAENASGFLQWSAGEVTQRFEQMRTLGIGPYRDAHSVLAPTATERRAGTAADTSVLRR